MRLLILQILNAVFDPAQKHIGLGQRSGGSRRHQIRPLQSLQRLQGGPRAQLRELTSTHHLLQLHGEFDLADAAARQLHVVGAIGPARAALGRVFADLPMQHAQRIEHVVVEIAAEHERQHRTTQRLCAAIVNAGARRDHAAFEPGETLPFAPVRMEIVFQCRE